jgi:glycosyltransferase involved in cell wall biosynthesis
MIDSYGLNFQRRALSGNFLSRWLLDWERFRIARYERSVAGSAAFSSVVSDVDRDFIGISKVHSIPLGIDLAPQGYRRSPVGVRLIFSGNMSYRPNIEAILWFVEECWFSIKKVIPDAELYIVGKSPAKRVSRLNSVSLGINVTGWVESTSDLFSASSVAIAPMRSGSGMQFKILEAMAHSVPVVATTLGRGDIKARDGVEIILADSPGDFVSEILRLIDDTSFNQMVGGSGLKYVLERHQWDKLNCAFCSELTDVSTLVS